MGLKASLSKQFARAAMVELKIRSSQPVSVQLKQLNDIVKTAAKTAFGKDHGLRDGMSGNIASLQAAIAQSQSAEGIDVNLLNQARNNYQLKVASCLEIPGRV